MYDSFMKELRVSDARDSLADIVNRVRYTGERVTLTRRGRAVAALVPVEDAELLEWLEDQTDLDAAHRALNEPGDRVSWDRLKAELGL